MKSAGQGLIAMPRRYRGRIERSPSRAVLHATFSVLGWLYGIAFGGFEELFYRRNRRRFISEINREFSDLFSERGGRVVPGEGTELPRSFDYVAVTVEFKDARIRLIRGRGELNISLAPPGSAQDWMDLSLLWDRTASLGWGKSPSCRDPLGEQVGRLQAHWDRLVEELPSGGLK